MNNRQTKSEITVDQIEYIKSLNPNSIERVGRGETRLNKSEFQKYRALTGQLSWAADNTRPDIAYDVRE